MRTHTKTEEIRMVDTRIPISADDRADLGELLNGLLGSTFDLYSQVKHAHWNVKGPNFIAYHRFFDRLATHVQKHSDTIAERCTALGVAAAGTARLVVDVSELPEYDLRAVDGKQHLIALCDRFGKLTGLLRDGMARADEIGDKVTADVLSQLVAEVEKDLWFLESHLAG